MDKNIKKSRNFKRLILGPLLGKSLIFPLLGFLCLLHMVEVTGSNPVSPTISFQ
jgi:hypothetical protein